MSCMYRLQAKSVHSEFSLKRIHSSQFHSYASSFLHGICATIASVACLLVGAQDTVPHAVRKSNYKRTRCCCLTGWYICPYAVNTYHYPT